MAAGRPIALSIAGSDPSGGAGIQADLKTFHQHGVYGCAVISLLTVQNTQRVERAQAVSAELLAAQLHAVLEDVRVAAIKTGALGSAENVQAVAEHMRTRSLPLVVDPVRIATLGPALLGDDARGALLEHLLPRAALVTPNAQEAAWLMGCEVRTLDEARSAARGLLETGVRAVLLKGGHLDEREAIDVYADANQLIELRGARVPGVSAHGLGCALSAAITARLAQGEALKRACREAKDWLARALSSAPAIGQGLRPPDHFAPVSSISAGYTEVARGE